MSTEKQLIPRQIRKILFWDPCLSPHKADFFECFASLNPSLEVICCVDQSVPENRRELGWTVPEPIHYKNIISPDKKTISALVSDSPLTTLHVFSGIRWVPTIVTALNSVKSLNAFYAIMSEPRVMDGWAGKLRLLQSWLTEGYHRRHAAAILAIGRNGPPWFIASGYSKKRIIPFAYFVPPPARVNYLGNGTGKTRIGYLGRLIKMKGVLDIVNAVKTIKEQASIDFAGTGTEEETLKLMCSSEGIDSKFRGVLPISDIGAFLAEIDILVLASISKDDGWGAVISEALMAGVPVITTPMVGASVLLRNDLFGRCVPANSPQAISNAVSDLIKANELTAQRRDIRALAATKVLSAHAGAIYLNKLIGWLEGKAERPLDFYSILDDAK